MDDFFDTTAQELGIDPGSLQPDPTQIQAQANTQASAGGQANAPGGPQSPANFQFDPSRANNQAYWKSTLAQTSQGDTPQNEAYWFPKFQSTGGLSDYWTSRMGLGANPDPSGGGGGTASSSVANLGAQPAQSPLVPQGTPQTAQAQQIATPAQLTAQSIQTPQATTWDAQTYNPAQAPTVFQGSRQATPAALTANPIAAPTQAGFTPATAPGAFDAGAAFQGNRQTQPGGFTYQNYGGLRAADLASDPSYQFRLQAGANALENSAASKGVLRTGNTAKGLIDYGQGAASQEYAAADARARATNAANNAGQLGAYTTNTANTLGVNTENYGRASTEAQQAIGNRLNAFNANAQTGLAYNQANNQGALASTQANNAANLATGQANNQTGLAVQQGNIANQSAANETNYGRAATEAQQGFANSNLVNQQNNAGQNASIAANNASRLGTASLNSQNALNFGNANNANSLAVQQGNIANLASTTQANNAANLAVAGQNNSYALGAGQLALGQQTAANNYALGQGSLGLAQNNQQFNQGQTLANTYYQQNTIDPWNQNFQLATLGNPGAPNPGAFAGQQTNTLLDQGNANASGTIGAANAATNALGNLGTTAQQNSYLAWLRSQPASGQTYAGGPG